MISPCKNESDTKQLDGRKPPTNPTMPLLYSSDDYIAVVKPADVRMDGDFNFTVEKFAKEHVDNLIASGVITTLSPPPRARFIHQLDYATSGVLLLGLQRRPTARVCKYFRERTVSKSYLALVMGCMDQSATSAAYEFEVDQPIAKGEGFMMTISPTGKESFTRGRVLRTGTLNGYPVTKVLLTPSSGRRHQLRLHMVHLGHPIVGDATYGDLPGLVHHSELLGLPDVRMCLHAYRLDVGGDIPTFSTDDPFVEGAEGMDSLKWEGEDRGIML
eukprot:gnl/Dysnectes_brevis/7028_a11427_442.p1 GENE.gnl/Dysnectes_brevis/7028_a11427_442~~gnl/Dysnectes_brevis/7028_a11427_442.p1  ORF type:complete len:273 (-),score=50.83 gnl/Dysnectes_brevis/7028_a11427_442:33-851(-)